MQFRFDTPRHERSLMRRKLLFGNGKLYLISPNVHGRPGWRYGIKDGNTIHVLPLQVKTRDLGIKLSTVYFEGIKASEYRVRTPKHKKSAAA